MERESRLRRGAIALVAVVVGAALLSSCGRTGAPARGAGGRIRVLAAENFWGSIAAQPAGTRASVRSILVNPETDPHDYEPTAGDARAIAGAQLMVVNGLGYDGWAPRPLAASPSSGREVLGLGGDANPHQWYAPRSVRRVAEAIAAAYERLDPDSAPPASASFGQWQVAELEGLAQALHRATGR